MRRKTLPDSKLELSSQKQALRSGADVVAVIVKVTAPNYVPPGMKVRSAIDEYMFTADCSMADVRKAERDPQVESIALSQPLQSMR